MELTAKQTIKGWLNSKAFLTYAEPLVGEGTKKGGKCKTVGKWKKAWLPTSPARNLNPLTPKIRLLILPSSCYTFPCKLVSRTKC